MSSAGFNAEDSTDQPSPYTHGQILYLSMFFGK